MWHPCCCFIVQVQLDINPLTEPSLTSHHLRGFPDVVFVLAAKAITKLRCYFLSHWCSVAYVDNAAMSIRPSHTHPHTHSGDADLITESSNKPLLRGAAPVLYCMCPSSSPVPCRGSSFFIILKSDRKALAGRSCERRSEGEGLRDEIAQDSGVQGH